MNIGKLLFSPTRTYAPIVIEVLKELHDKIHGIVHCSGGAQTKVLHFINNNLHVIKDNLFDVPPLFKIIQKESGTPCGMRCTRFSTWATGWEIDPPGRRYADHIMDVARHFKNSGG